MMRKICAVLLVLSFCTELVLSNTAAAAKADVKLAKPGMKLAVDKTTRIKVTAKRGIKVIKITYKSQNSKIVTVDKKGNVKAKKAGSAKIKVTVKYKKKGKTSKTTKKTLYCKVTVESRNESGKATVPVRTDDVGAKTTATPIPTPTNSADAEPTDEPNANLPATPLPTGNPEEIHNPRTSGFVTTWDCIYFGSYCQNTTKEPIKWRVLSVDGNDAFLLADKNLDCQSYNLTENNRTWETCTLRKWLNDTFIQDAFSESEQLAIKETEVVDNGNPFYGVAGGNSTTDKVYLLSLEEVTKSRYGFSTSETEEAEDRRALNTAYAEEQGAYTSPDIDYAGNGTWWLRSPGWDNECAAVVQYDGQVRRSGATIDVIDVAVRPVLHLDLSCTSEWSPAGTVASDRTVIESPAKPTDGADANLPATPLPTGNAEEISTPVPTSDADANLSATPLPTGNPEEIHNPRTSGFVTTWDCIYFGSYWQNTTKEPIKWRVLSVDGNDAFLLADKNLDCQSYNVTENNRTWETCTLRKWLNDTFIKDAFSESEQLAIKETEVVDNGNPFYEVVGGNSTTDKVYLLSLEEVTKSRYGFSTSETEEAEDRRSLNTAYAEEQGAYTSPDIDYVGNGTWWLRSPGWDNECAAVVQYDGQVRRSGATIDVIDVAVRPVLHLDLSCTSDWSPAGTVASDGTVIDYRQN